MFTLGAWVVVESGVVFTPRGMHLISICVHIFAAPLWRVGLTNPKQLFFSFIDHRGMVWKCAKLKWNRVVSLQSDWQRKAKCMVWFDINSRVATVREKQGKNKNFSRSGKSQGIFWKVRENLWYCQSQWIFREFCFRFMDHKFSSRFKKMHFLSGKMKSMLQSKQSDQYLTLYALLM